MKTPNFTLLACLFISLYGTMSAQLSGTAHLAGQSNHSGIKVKFSAMSGTSVTDSCLTNGSGNYSISISGGLYIVTFSKIGYQTYLHNSGGLTALTNTTVIPSLTLAAGTSSYVAGSVSGTWLSSTTYYVQGSLNIPANSTLVIQSGTEIKFLGNYSITVNGAIQATGTSALPIKFSPSNPLQSWGTIDLFNGPNLLDFCEFENFYNISTSNANSRISNCRLNNSQFGISLQGGTVSVENNDIINARISGIGGFTGSGTITCNRVSAPLYKNDFLYNNWGIHVNGSELVSDNDVHDCQLGVHIYFTSTSPTVTNNYIHDNHLGLNVDENVGTTLLIANNTLNQNGRGVNNTHSGLQLSNNIIATSSIAITGVAMGVDHNLIFNCATNFSLNSIPPGLGQIVNTNSNGDPIDSYYNLFISPDFGNIMPFLQSGSPALNAGNSSYSSYIGVAHSSNQCYSSGLTSLSESNMQHPLRIYPNPSNDVFNLELSTVSKILVYDLSGKEILSQSANEGNNVIDLRSYPKGVYICVIKVQNNLSRVKLITF